MVLQAPRFSVSIVAYESSLKRMQVLLQYEQRIMLLDNISWWIWYLEEHFCSSGLNGSLWAWLFSSRQFITQIVTSSVLALALQVVLKLFVTDKYESCPIISKGKQEHFKGPGIFSLGNIQYIAQLVSTKSIYFKCNSLQSHSHLSRFVS